MALKTFVAAAAVVCVMHAGAIYGQSVSAEAAVNAGHSASTDAVSAAGAQLRAFGDAAAGIRFFTEVALAKSSDDLSDAFGAAYPYAGHPQLIEAYAERMFRPRNALLNVRAGRYRTPFGISSGTEQGYVGFFRAPLIRYDGYYGISNNFLEHGVDLVAGVPKLTLETSIGAPAEVGTAERRSDVDTVVRLQAFHGPFIAGVSRIWTMPYQDPRFSIGRAVFTGIDLRWMYEGIGLRGEWLTGKPFDDTTTTGWYVDIIVHRVHMGPITAVARVERTDYDVPARPSRDLHALRQTIGARIRIMQGLSAQVNLLHQSGLLNAGGTALDVGVTYSVRRDFRRP